MSKKRGKNIPMVDLTSSVSESDYDMDTEELPPPKKKKPSDQRRLPGFAKPSRPDTVDVKQSVFTSESQYESEPDETPVEDN